MFYSGNAHYTIMYSEPLKLAEIVWQGVVSSEQFQAALLDILHVLKEKRVTYFVSDARKLNPFPLEDHTWLKNHFFTELNKTEVTKFARIMEPGVLAQAILGNIAHFVIPEEATKFEVQNFYAREEALDWVFFNEVTV